MAQYTEESPSGGDLTPALWLALFISLCFALAISSLSAGCDEKSFGPPPRQNVEVVRQPPSQPLEEPTLLVGDVNMPMPVPSGFKRLPAEHPLMLDLQAELGNEETLLCIFERTADADSQERQVQDLVQVSTLRKWLNAGISTIDFSRLKQPWQEESIVFNQNALVFFEEAARNQLRGQTHFSYNLGMIDSGPLHISFLKVIKHTTPNQQAVYICNTNTLLWRHGKILRLTYNSPIRDFKQIRAVVAESVGYLQKLQSQTAEPAGNQTAITPASLHG
ncbi:MAG: hypothetical protein FWG17_01010 [Desulfovibrionaceae bacterium]|nr:hypothetical protein [Desulfovibrionaceae bacterium]